MSDWRAIMTPQKATLDSMRTRSCFVSYRRLSAQFQFPLSAYTLVYLSQWCDIPLCGKPAFPHISRIFMLKSSIVRSVSFTLTYGLKIEKKFTLCGRAQNMHPQIHVQFPAAMVIRNSGNFTTHWYGFMKFFTLVLISNP